MKVVEINQEPTELFKILKIEGLVVSGGMAKIVIADGQVSVNGSVDTRKRMKIMAGDVIEYQSLKYKIELK